MYLHYCIGCQFKPNVVGATDILSNLFVRHVIETQVLRELARLSYIQANVRVYRVWHLLPLGSVRYKLWWTDPDTAVEVF